VSNRKKNWWRLDQTEQLKKLYPTGMTCAEISKIIGKPRSAVASKAARLGMVHPRTEDRKALEQAAREKAAHKMEMQLRNIKPSTAKPSLAPIPQPKGTSNV